MKISHALLCLILAASSAHDANCAHAAPEKARPADSLAESVGVGTRFDWLYNDQKLGLMNSALRDSKIRYARIGYLPEGGDPLAYTRDIKQMALDLNVRVCLQMGWNSRAEMTQAFERWMAAPSPVYALEGPNEAFERPDWGSKEWENSLDVQKYLWQIGRPRNLAIYSWTLGGPAGFYWHMPREADQYSTHANFHHYHWYTNPHGRGNTKAVGLWQNTETPENRGLVTTVRNDWMRNPNKPLVSTEFGWGLDTLPGNYVGVTPEVQAKYLSRAIFENFNAQVERGYIYSLFPHNDDFGIANADGSLRPSGQAIANLLALTEERGQDKIATGSLDWELKVDSGLATVDNRQVRDDEIHHTLLQKKSGKYLLALWADKDSQQGDDKPEPATLTLPNGAAQIRIFKPMTNGTAPVATRAQVARGGRVRLEGQTAIPDHPLLLEITPIA